MADWRSLVRDVYLADAVDGFSKELGTLRHVDSPEDVERQVYLLCELSRDAMVRLIPFEERMRPVIRGVQGQCREALEVLDGKPDNASILQYRSHIEKRIQEYAVFVGAS